MKKVNTANIPEDAWVSPKGKFGNSSKGVSHALGREPASTDLLRGHIETTCKVFETDSAGSTAAWHQNVTVFWPENGPMDANHGSDNTVRTQVLSTFSGKLAGAFYDHRDVDPSTRDKMEQ